MIPLALRTDALFNCTFALRAADKNVIRSNAALANSRGSAVKNHLSSRSFTNQQ
jgi:hypothetical protein